MKRILFAALTAAALFSDGILQSLNAQNMEIPKKVSPFPVGDKLPEQFSKYFIGQAWLAPLTDDKRLNAPVSNVTFSPGCRNNWHSHTGGQLLIAVGGRGYYQEKGRPARALLPGDIVEIAPDVVHWHGAAPDSWFSHLAIECNPQTNKNMWLERVSDQQYAEATKDNVATGLKATDPELDGIFSNFTKEVQEYACAGREQEGAQKGYGKREEKTVSDKVIGARNRRSEKKLEDTLEKNVTEKKKAALTFDDGPNSQYTPLLLKGLKERGVHATFFLMGKNIEGKEALVKQIQEEGHLIGNHTYNHVQLDKISKEAAKEEIETTNQKIFEITGVYPAWLRPPYGEWRKNLDFYVEMFPVLWDVDTLDWKSKNVDSIMKIVRSEVSDGAVILMHDAYQSSVDAALQIVDLLMAEEYEFVTVEELILP